MTQYLEEKRKEEQPAPAVPVQTERRSMQLYPLFFRAGPVALGIFSVSLIALMAILYLSQLGQAVSANQQLETLQAEQAQLQRQNQDLINTIGEEQSPSFIEQQALKQNMVLSDPKNTQIILVPHLQPARQPNHLLYP